MKSIKNYITVVFKEIFNLLSFNLVTLTFYVLLYFLFNVIISYSIYYGFLDLMMKVMGASYIDSGAVVDYLKNPVVLLLLIIGLLIFSMISILEVGGIIHIFSMSRIGRKTSLKYAVYASLNGCFKTFIPSNWFIMLYLLLFLPLLGVFTVSTNYLEFFVPEFIMDYINANTVLHILWIIFIICAIIFFIFSCFSLNFYFTGDGSFIQACKKSFKLVKKRKIKTIIIVLISIILFYVFNVGISAIIANIASAVSSVFKASKESNFIITDIYESEISKILDTVLFQIITPVLNLSVLTALFYEYQDEDESLTQFIKKETFNPKAIGMKAIPVILILTLSIGYYVYEHYRYFDAYVSTPQKFQVIAHRGDSVRAPENTYPAFELALLEGVEYLELDVQQTKDGVIVVSHDDSLKKITGKNEAIHEISYDELMNIDVGSRFSDQFSGLRMSTLDEILKLISSYENARVQIEIKISEYDNHLEKELVKVINDNSMGNKCDIICLNPEPLKRIHDIDPSLHLIYTMSLAYGDISKFDFVDGFSIEQSNISLKLVEEAHKNGKTVYAWTANSGKTIQYLMDCGVDGVLTDDPIMLFTAIDRANYNGGFSKLVRIWFNMLSVS